VLRGNWFSAIVAGVNMHQACMAVMALSCGVAPGAGAVEFRVESSTIGDAYQLVTSGNEVLNRNRLHQYLGLSLFDIEGSGESRWSFTSLFRFDVDFGLSDEELERVPTQKRSQLSIQYAWLEGRDLLGGLIELKVGRQLLADGLDYLMFDGAVVTVNSPWFFAVEVMAGSEVKHEMWGINASQLEVDGTRFIEGVEENGDDPTLAFGAALVTRNLAYARYRLAYRRYFSAGAVDQEKIGGSFHQRIVPGLDLTGVVTWDMFNGRFERIQAGGRARAGDANEIDLEYVRTTPSFDGDSIFNIFATYPMNDVNLRWRLYPGKQDRIYAGGKLGFAGNEGYQGEVLYGEVDTMVVGFGAMAGWARFFGERGSDGRVTVDVSFDGGYAGDRFLADVGGVWAVVPREWELEGRITALVFDDAIQRELNALSFGYQLGGRYLIDKRAAFALVAEHNMNRLQTHQFRVFALIDVDLWL
jgi:hypothetical protein